MFKKWYLIVLLILAIPLSIYAQDDNKISFENPVFLWSAGQLDAKDMSVYYSLFVASGEEPISELTVSAAVPEGASFVDAFWTPETTTFSGESDGIVSWELPALGPDTIIGPFTFHVTFDNADAEDFAPQGAAEGNISWGDMAVGSQAFGDETLSVLEDTGEITIEPSGTIDLVPVGETGAWIIVPADSVSEAVTLTINRLAITEDADLPALDFETWWCGQYSITADKDVTFNQPIMLLLPIRRALTPAMDVAVFSLSEAGEWTVLSDGVVETTDGETASAVVSRDGLLVEVYLDAANFTTTPEVFAVGVSAKKRVTSSSKPGVAGDTGAPWF